MRIDGGRFLVVGGAGFIGSHLVDLLLARGAAEVRVYDNFSRGRLENLTQALPDPRLQIFEPKGDILHMDTLLSAMQGMDGVFHLAALWLLQCFEYPRSAFAVNVEGTMNVVEALMACGVRKLVFSSSASVYGESVSEPMREDHPLNCVDFYGASKVCGEMIVRSMHQRAQSRKEQPFDFVGLRYMNVYGPRQYDDGEYISVVVNMLNALDAAQAPVIHGNGEQAYDFVHVEDCAQANISAMESDVTGEFFNVGTGTKTSIRSLADTLTSLHPSGLQAEYREISRPAVRNRLGSIEKASQMMAFNARISIEQGLAQYVNWRQSLRARKP